MSNSSSSGSGSESASDDEHAATEVVPQAPSPFAPVIKPTTLSTIAESSSDSDSKLPTNVSRSLNQSKTSTLVTTVNASQSSVPTTNASQPSVTAANASQTSVTIARASQPSFTTTNASRSSLNGEKLSGSSSEEGEQKSQGCCALGRLFSKSSVTAPVSSPSTEVTTHKTHTSSAPNYIGPSSEADQESSSDAILKSSAQLSSETKGRNQVLSTDYFRSNIMNRPALSNTTTAHAPLSKRVRIQHPSTLNDRLRRPQRDHSGQLHKSKSDNYEDHGEKKATASKEDMKGFLQNVDYLQENVFNITDINERLKQVRFLLFGDLIQYPPPLPECHCQEVYEEAEKDHVTNCECGLKNCGCECCGCEVKTKPPTIVDREALKEKRQKNKNIKDGNAGQKVTWKSSKNETNEIVVGKVEVDAIAEMPITVFQEKEQVTYTTDVNNNLVQKKQEEKIITETKTIRFQLPLDDGALLMGQQNETRIETYMAKVQHTKTAVSNQTSKSHNVKNSNVQSSKSTNKKETEHGSKNSSEPGHRNPRGRKRSRSKGSRTRRCHKRARSRCCCCEEESESSSSGDDDGCCSFPSQFLWFILQMNSTAQYYKSQIAYQHAYQQQLQDQDDCEEDIVGSDEIGSSESSSDQKSPASTIAGGSDSTSTKGKAQPQVKRLGVHDLEDIIARQGQDSLVNKEVAITLRPFNPNTADNLPEHPLIDMKALKLFAHGEKETAECCCDQNKSSCGNATGSGRGCCGGKKEGKDDNNCPVSPPTPPCCGGQANAMVPRQQNQQCTFPFMTTPVCQVPFSPQAITPTGYYNSPYSTYPCYPSYPMAYPPPYPYPYSPPPLYPYGFGLPYAPPTTVVPVPVLPSCVPSPWGMGGMIGPTEGEYGPGQEYWNNTGENNYWEEHDPYLEDTDGHGETSNWEINNRSNNHDRNLGEGGGSGNHRRSSGYSGSSGQQRNSGINGGRYNENANGESKSNNRDEHYKTKGTSYPSSTNINIKYVRGPPEGK